MLAAQDGGTATIRLSPQDTYLNLDQVSYAQRTTLRIYTWPAQRAGNVALLKFDLSSVPAGAVVQRATLRLALIGADPTSSPTYNVSAHKILHKNVVVAQATGLMSDGTMVWSPSACCFNGLPLAQSDLSAPEDVQAIDKALGFKWWTITEMVREWLATPSTNQGVLLNADATMAIDHYRDFASTEHANSSLWPYLEIEFSAAEPNPPPVPVTGPGAGTTPSGTIPISANPSVPSAQLASNEYPGLTLVSDQPWDLMYSLGWDYLRRTSSEDDSVVTDPSAPYSGSNALRIVFTPSMEPDSEPSVHWKGVPDSKEVYASWWMKMSPNWTCSAAGCGKISFLFTEGFGQVYSGVFHHSETSDNPPYRIAANTEWPPYGQMIWFPNVTTTPINPGEWHRYEFYYKWETIPGATEDGIIRYWVDGVLNGNYTTVTYPPGSFIEFQFAPTLQYPPPTEQYIYIDHTRLSAR